jgi:hypothetical protein
MTAGEAALRSKERNRLGDGNTRWQERSLSTFNPRLSTEKEPILLLFIYTHGFTGDPKFKQALTPHLKKKMPPSYEGGILI